MIDLHTHILPYIDDGSDSIEDTLTMLRQSDQDGVTAVVATPHFDQEYNWLNYASTELERSLQDVRDAAKNAGIRAKILPGMEIHAFDGMVELLEKGRLLTINRTNYVLTEFDTNEPERWCSSILERLIAAGLTPVIAHPERYDFVAEKPWLVCDWLDLGCLTQITRSSMTGSFGSKITHLTETLLDEGWVSCIASDGHKPGWRTTELRSGYEYLKKRYSARLADELMTINPQRIIDGKPV